MVRDAGEAGGATRARIGTADAATPAATGELFDEAFLRRLSYLQVVAKKAFAGRARAERRTRRAGSGLEFADHRGYQHGDDLRYLDWNVYGRLGRLLLRLFEEEEDLHIHFLLDASRSMAGATDEPATGERTRGRAAPGPSKFDRARQVVAALAYVGLCNLDRVSVIPFGGPSRRALPEARGKGQIFPVLDFLRALSPSGETDLRAAVQSFIHRVPRRGLAVLVSDFYDPAGYQGPLDLLRYHRFEPMALQVVDEVPVGDGWLGDVELYDCETEDARDLTLTPRLLRAYREEHQAFCDELHAFCAARAIPSLAAPADTPFDELVLTLLREGGFLR